jgi:thermostable 8-oxoguanine DNA glycosylase
LSSYKNIKDFNALVDSFPTNTPSRLALPLLLQEEIFGFGFALACDFLKENGHPDFVKPDRHINFIAKKLGITKATSDFQIFKDVISYCRRIDAIPYEVDKLFWLVGSGDFYLSTFKVNSLKANFVKQVLAKK